MARRLFWAEKLRIPVHSAPSRPFATCSAHDQSSGSDFRSQCAMARHPLSPRLTAREYAAGAIGPRGSDAPPRFAAPARARGGKRRAPPWAHSSSRGLAEVEKGRDVTRLLTHVLAQEAGGPLVLAA